MPELSIRIGGRSYAVACQPGEESFLEAAAQLLDTEAKSLSQQIGSMPENRMLLMAGLLLADKTAAIDDKLRTQNADLETLKTKLATLEAQAEGAGSVSAETLDKVAELTAQAEALADQLEQAMKT